MKNAVLLIAIFVIALFSISSSAQINPATKNFIPEGWKLLQQADGDLNKDAVPDAVLLIEEIAADASGAHARSLLVLLRNQNQQYDLAVQAEKAVPPAGASIGAKIDPTKGVRIEKGILLTNFTAQTEAGEKLDVTYTYRYQNNDFYLVGAIQKGISGTLTYTSDYNASTGNLIVERTDSANPELKNFNEVREMPDIPLSGFDPGMMVFFLSAKAKSGPVKTYSTTMTTKITSNQASETAENVADVSETSSTEEVTSSGPLPDYGLVAWYQLNGNADDMSGEGNTGVVKNATPTTDRKGNANSAYLFDKKSVIGISTLNSKKKLTVPFTICAWFMTNNKDSFFQTIASLGRTANLTAFSLGYGLPRKKNVLYFDLNGRTPFGLQVEADPSVGTNWHFVVGTVDETSVKLYLDGNLIGSKTVDAIETSALKRTMEQTTLPIEIGRDLPYLGRFFNGSIDDVMFYNRALSEDEVKLVMAGLEKK
jgi:hypothetical protein